MKTVTYGSTTYEVPEWATQVMFDEIEEKVRKYEDFYGLAAETALDIIRIVERHRDHS